MTGLISKNNSPISIKSRIYSKENSSFWSLRGYLIYSCAMAAKILANLIVMGGGILARAFVQAYRQALANASKNGVAQETIQNTIRRANKVMTEQEAREILGVKVETPWEEIVKKYDNLFESNAKNGSFYLQSKVHRAKERLEAVHQDMGQGTPS